eukprot:9185954-Pyramimonas_sp.AAC.1
MVSLFRSPCWSPTCGDATWTTRVSLDNLMARLRDHPRDCSGVPHARIMLTCVLPLMIEIRDIAGGAIRTTTIENVRA